MSKEDTYIAASLGSIDKLKALKEYWDKYTASYAAKEGHLECLKYLHKNGACKHWTITLNAAVSGHLDCLNFCLENKVAYTAEIPVAVSNSENGNGSVECFIRLFQQWRHPYVFWNNPFYNQKFINNKIDLEDERWRPLLEEEIDLHHYPELQSRVNNIKKN